MNIEQIFQDLKFDLQSISIKANERLLKEEQIRSSIYCSLRNQGYIVAAERNYEKNSEVECDLVFWRNSKPESESWMEIKTARYSKAKDDVRKLDKFGKNSWNNGEKGQFNSWKKDIQKFNLLNNIEVEKYFVLVEQCFDDSLFDKMNSQNLYEIKQLFGELKYNKIEFELKWNKAPVNKCIVRIFELKNYSKQPLIAH
ncbi:hypothetical protein [Christiangramia echinicola]|uniref:Uncharacterized protein n=1 Tax=Christiangramia echinicola TaxID=279359 RepID=A0A1H1M5K6_9FLAO|nr:hypothetical protein [Christiangramia echinicola]SDR81685.1 hypothetical protein SAMN04488552_1151 [Christiangramia echinicola]